MLSRQGTTLVTTGSKLNVSCSFTEKAMATYNSEHTYKSVLELGVLAQPVLQQLQVLPVLQLKIDIIRKRQVSNRPIGLLLG